MDCSFECEARDILQALNSVKIVLSRSASVVSCKLSTDRLTLESYSPVNGTATVGISVRNIGDKDFVLTCDVNVLSDFIRRLNGRVKVNVNEANRIVTIESHRTQYLFLYS